MEVLSVTPSNSLPGHSPSTSFHFQPCVFKQVYNSAIVDLGWTPLESVKRLNLMLGHAGWSRSTAGCLNCCFESPIKKAPNTHNPTLRHLLVWTPGDFLKLIYLEYLKLMQKTLDMQVLHNPAETTVFRFVNQAMVWVRRSSSFKLFPSISNCWGTSGCHGNGSFWTTFLFCF